MWCVQIASIPQSFHIFSTLSLMKTGQVTLKWVQVYEVVFDCSVNQAAIYWLLIGYCEKARTSSQCKQFLFDLQMILNDSNCFVPFDYAEYDRKAEVARIAVPAPWHSRNGHPSQPARQVALVLWRLSVQLHRSAHCFLKQPVNFRIVKTDDSNVNRHARCCKVSTHRICWILFPAFDWRNMNQAFAERMHLPQKSR